MKLVRNVVISLMLLILWPVMVAKVIARAAAMTTLHVGIAILETWRKP